MSVIGGEVGEFFGGKPATAGERWRAGVGAESDYADRAVKNTEGILGTVTDLSSIAAGGPAGALVRGGAKTALPSGKILTPAAETVAQTAPTTAQKVGNLAMTGAGQGAVEGAARNAEDWGSAGRGALVGGAVGGAGSALLGALTGRLTDRATRSVNAASREGGSEALFESGGAVYKKLDDAGIKFGGSQTPKLVQDTVQTMADKGFNKEIHKDLTPIVEQIGALKGKDATWSQLQQIRTQISSAKASESKEVRRMARELSDVMDDFVAKAKPTLPARSVGLNVAEEAGKARDLWRRGSMAENVEYLERKGTTLSKDPATKVQKNFENYRDRVDKPGRFDPYANSPDERELLTKIIEGSPKTSGAASTLNRWGGNLLGYGTAGAVGGAALPLYFNDTVGVGSGASGAGATAMALGMLSKGGSKILQRKAAEQGGQRVDDLVRQIVTGSTGKAAVQNVPRADLARILAEQALTRGAGRYGASYVNTE